MGDQISFLVYTWTTFSWLKILLWAMIVNDFPVVADNLLQIINQKLKPLIMKEEKLC